MANETTAMSIYNFSWNLHDVEYQIYKERGMGVAIYLGLLCVIGTIGNIHVLIVFPRKYSPSNFKIFIVGMAIVDILACTLVIPFEIIDERYMYTFDNETVCKTFRFLSYSLTILSGFLLLLIAVERFRKICRPFSSQMKRRTVYIMCVILITVAVGLTAPNCIVQRINIKSVIGYEGLKGTNCGATKTEFSSLYYGFLLLISTTVLIIVVTIYAIILRTIWKHRQSLFLITNRESANFSLSDFRLSSLPDDNVKRNSAAGRESFASSEDDEPIILSSPNSPPNSRPSSMVEVQTRKKPSKLHRAVRNTLMLMVASFISYCGMLPVIVLSIIRNVDPKIYGVIKSELGVVMTILVRGFFLNNVVNPYVYCFMDSKFRKECKALYSAISSALYRKCKRIS